jgi:Cytolethal distending toxin A/C domain
MRRVLSKLGIAAGVAATAAAVTLSNAVPAFADHWQNFGAHWQNWGNGLCLDSNYAGDVYTSPCDTNSNWQTWDVTSLGSDEYQLKNRQTQRCLSARWPDMTVVSVGTEDCNGAIPSLLEGPDLGNIHMKAAIGGPRGQEFCYDSGHNGPGPLATDAVHNSGTNCNYGFYQTWRTI